MSHQAGPSAADSPALVVTTTTVHKYAMKKKEILNAEESELYELSQAAGITVDQEVFKIMVDLLKMNVAPQAVFQTLKAMCAGQRVPESCSGDSTAASHVTGIPSTKAEARAQQDESLSSGKSAKMPAGAPAGPGPRGARISAKMAAYGTQDAGGAPHAQARSKAAPSSSANPAEKTREASGQRAQRQPSASRGQKTKSSGSSSSSSQM
ncbi:mitotic-spindle organizing protein 2 isoform X2 [Hippocampus comes]|uniref:mitotic-spindle organizing protein 2 isoform X2 n=1 Tax=Hippocampus comes TaxID=109280 RepID=UPI00094E8B08|nr:PREDICTED: mitotic-spindle organizing protein 2-like isoform X2 [Hippocampus comes]